MGVNPWFAPETSDLTEYVCLTVVALAGETESAFKARLAAFWTHMLRNNLETYERVYAEATRFGLTDGGISRQYMVEADAATAVVDELSTLQLRSLPIDADDTYTKYEATSPDWFQISH